MTGRRLPDGFECTTPELERLGVSEMVKGAYWKDSNGQWAVCTPNGRIGSIAKHVIVEHEDGTITVSPSILVYLAQHARYDEHDQLVTYEAPEWHGFLERGVWRTV